MFFKIRLLTLFVSLLIICPAGYSQAVNNNVFRSGESLRFKGSYFMSSLWADLAEIKTEVSDYSAEGKSLYSITATASTYSNYDSFFRIRDLYQTWTDKNEVRPYIFKRIVDEGGYQFSMKYIIQRNLMQARYEYRKKEIVKTGVIKITDNTQDLVSVLYYVRTMDFEKMALNKIITVPTLIDDRIQNITVTFKGKETVKTEVFGAVPCYRLEISVNNKALVNIGSNNIWLTANRSRVPVQVKAEIPVGSIQLKLVEAKGIIQ
jgi:hypothetical protein